MGKARLAWLWSDTYCSCTLPTSVTFLYLCRSQAAGMVLVTVRLIIHHITLNVADRAERLVYIMNFCALSSPVPTLPASLHPRRVWNPYSQIILRFDMVSVCDISTDDKDNTDAPLLMKFQLMNFQTCEEDDCKCKLCFHVSFYFCTPILPNTISSRYSRHAAV